jgi:hypothetical protein
MDLASADALLATYLTDNWSHTPIAWENVEPRNWSSAGQPLLPEGLVDYVQVRTFATGNSNITVDRSCIRTRVQIQIAVCVKSGTGTRSAKGWQDELNLLLENALLSDGSGVLRLSTMIGSEGYPAVNGWYVYESAFAGYFERFRSVA